MMEGVDEMEIQRQTDGVANGLDFPFADQRHPSSWSDSDLLARILDGVADGIAAHDASGQLLFINDAGARMCGYESPAAALMAPPRDFLTRVQTFDANGSALTEAELPGPLAAQGQVVPERLVRLRLRASGCERWLAVKATPILDRRGAVRMSISIFRDVSREKVIEAEHERVVRELELERARLERLVDRLRAQVGGDDSREDSDR